MNKFVEKSLPYAVGIGVPVLTVVGAKELGDVYLRCSGEGSISWNDVYHLVSNMPLFAKIPGAAFLTSLGGMFGCVTNKAIKSLEGVDYDDERKSA